MIKKCSKGKRHKWSFSKNIMVKRIYSSGSIQLKLCGLYQCECGARKQGMATFTKGES